MNYPEYDDSKVEGWFETARDEFRNQHFVPVVLIGLSYNPELESTAIAFMEVAGISPQGIVEILYKAYESRKKLIDGYQH